jgi:deoxyribodipyrimidine photo-lyase
MWQSLPFTGTQLPAPEWLSAPPHLTSLGMPDVQGNSLTKLFPAGEVEAQRRLEKFTSSMVYHYADYRNRLDIDGTSSLSPYLRFGMLSARQAAWAVREAEALAVDSITRNGAETWLNELIWREFYAAIMYHFPYVRETAFRPALRSVRWRDDQGEFHAWAEGRTGYPVVDAAMRQLNITGWMHNRARMITASFLVKDLLIDWRHGERYFMQHLLDGDPAANNGGWQWTAGTGTDAAPYFRVFNPVLQGKKFDPKGTYVRRWVPELSAVPDAYIHAPWEMPTSLQAKLGCVIGKAYPSPIVDHAMARQRVMEAYRQGER